MKTVQNNTFHRLARFWAGFCCHVSGFLQHTYSMYWSKLVLYIHSTCTPGNSMEARDHMFPSLILLVFITRDDRRSASAGQQGPSSAARLEPASSFHISLACPACSLHGAATTQHGESLLFRRGYSRVERKLRGGGGAGSPRSIRLRRREELGAV